MVYSDNIPKKQVARMLGLSETTIVRLVKKNDLPLPYRLGGRTFYSKTEVVQWEKDKKLIRGFGPKNGH